MSEMSAQEIREYAVNHLQTMGDDILNYNAARMVMGYEYVCNDLISDPCPYWSDAGVFQCHVHTWNPCHDRNQSEKLLRQMAHKGFWFKTLIDTAPASEEVVVSVSVQSYDLPETPIPFQRDIARTETVAAILAALEAANVKEEEATVKG